MQTFEWVCNAAKGQGSSRYNEGNVSELAFSSWSIFVRSFCREWTSATAVLPYIPQEINYKKTQTAILIFIYLSKLLCIQSRMFLWHKRKNPYQRIVDVYQVPFYTIGQPFDCILTLISEERGTTQNRTWRAQCFPKSGLFNIFLCPFYA